MVDQRNRLLASIANITTDYRAGEIDPPSSDHIDRWISQFEWSVQLGMLAELEHVITRTYFSKRAAQRFLSGLATDERIAGDDPCSFWRDVGFLDIQGGGNSQREMLEMFHQLLREEGCARVEDRDETPTTYLYLDDAIFSGNRLKNDLSAWIQSDAPREAHVLVVTIALHRGGKYYANDAILKAARGAGKKVKIDFWRCIALEDRRTYTNSSDVLRPTGLPDDERTRNYVSTFTHAPVFRKPPSIGENKLFSSEEGRHLLEQELLKAGVRIREECPYLNVYQRPLGNMVLETLGFGSMLVTFRNCPNNCPLAFWAGDPWYPLFPRKTN